MFLFSNIIITEIDKSNYFNLKGPAVNGGRLIIIIIIKYFSSRSDRIEITHCFIRVSTTCRHYTRMVVDYYYYYYYE